MYQVSLFLKHIYGNRFSGEFLSNQKGDGYDLEDFREYQIGDNIKKINWKLSAKYDKEYISIYKQEKEPILDIFIDLNANTTFFQSDLKNYLNFLYIFIKKLGIRKNIYVGEYKGFINNKFFLKKYKSFDDINIDSQKKSCIKDIISTNEFNQKNYKIIISDLFFLDKLNFDNKTFLSIIPTIKILEKSSFPILNGYFSPSFNKDLIDNYKSNIKNCAKLEFI